MAEKRENMPILAPCKNTFSIIVLEGTQRNGVHKID